MKKCILTLCTIALTISASAQIDSLVNVHQNRIDELEMRVSELQKADASLKNSDAAITTRIDSMDEQLVSLRSADEENAGAIVSANKTLSQSIQGVSEQAKDDTQKVSNNLFTTIIIGAIVALLILLTALLLFFWLRKKNDSAFDQGNRIKTVH